MLEKHKHHDTLHFPMVLGLAFVLLGLPAYMHVEAQVVCPTGYVCTPVAAPAPAPAASAAPAANSAPAGTTYSNGYYYYGNGYSVPATNYYSSQQAPQATSGQNTGTTPGYSPQTSTQAGSPLTATCTGTPNPGVAPTVLWGVRVAGGVAPYSYSWSAYNDVLRYASGSTDSSSITIAYSSTGSKQAFVSLTDARGTRAYATCSSGISTSATAGTGQTTPSTTQTSAGPTTSLTLSSNTITIGQAVTLHSTTNSPSGSLRSAAIDMSRDNVAWQSGFPCEYWNSATSADTSKSITCSLMPSEPGTYYFRSRGSDRNGASSFIYQTLRVSAAPQSSVSQNTSAQVCGGTAPMGNAVHKGASTYTAGVTRSNHWTFVTSNPGACEWTCAPGNGLTQGGFCYAAGVLPAAYNSTQACEGTAPVSSGYVSMGRANYSTGYSPSRWTYVRESPNACQYTCVNGGVSNGSGCTAPQSTTNTTVNTTQTQFIAPNWVEWGPVPRSVVAGRTFTFIVYNTSGKAWGSAHDLGLSSGNLATNYQFINLGGTASGGSKSVTFTAPTAPGTYVLRAVEQNVEWFGQNQTITVTAQ